MTKKNKDVEKLSDIDANFVISQFKNKERLNSPSSIPRALIPPAEEERLRKEKETVDTVNESDDANITNVISESDVTNSSDISDTDTAAAETTVANDNTKRSSLRHRKEAFKQYQKLFLTTPKIKHRKPVFISEELRERLDEIARKLGCKGMSASGFIENMAIQHLKTYEEDIEFWRKL